MPSSPRKLEPQHFASPLNNTAQVLELPAEIVDTPEDFSNINTGVNLLVVVPSPSCPWSLAPQHFTTPE
jgi:hypothetical protein